MGKPVKRGTLGHVFIVMTCPMRKPEPGVVDPPTCPMRKPDPSSVDPPTCPMRNLDPGSVDPRNMMPVLPQTPTKEQSIVLSKERETSSIPKAGENANWVYPSPQQFYHALLMKN